MRLYLVLIGILRVCILASSAWPESLSIQCSSTWISPVSCVRRASLRPTLPPPCGILHGLLLAQTSKTILTHEHQRRGLQPPKDRRILQKSSKNIPKWCQKRVPNEPQSKLPQKKKMLFGYSICNVSTMTGALKIVVLGLFWSATMGSKMQVEKKTHKKTFLDAETIILGPQNRFVRLHWVLTRGAIGSQIHCLGTDVYVTCNLLSNLWLDITKFRKCIQKNVSSKKKWCKHVKQSCVHGNSECLQVGAFL